MILFSPLRTKRVSVRLKELTLDQAITLCRLPADRNEMVTTELLRAVAADADAPRPGYVTDPRLWTVSERTRLVCHYLMQVADDGPDFTMGEAKLSDYITFDLDSDVKAVDLGPINGTAMVARPLLGIHAEFLERECKTRGDWVIGSLAVQVRPASEKEPDFLGMTEVDLITWHKKQIQALRTMPESSVEALLVAFHAAQNELRQFFTLSFDDKGINCQSISEEAGLAPARFLASTCVGPGTRRLFG